MISSVTIEKFRGIREGTVDGLSPISILVGPNNSGKSTCLEALYAVAVGASLNLTIRRLIRRGGKPMHALAKALPEPPEVMRIKASSTGPISQDVVVLTIPQVRDPAIVDAAAREHLDDDFVAVQVVHTRTANGQSSAAQRHLSALDRQGHLLSAPIFMGHTLHKNELPRFVDVEAVRAVGALEDAVTDLDNNGKLPMVIKTLASSMAGLKDLRILKAEDEFVLHTIIDGKPPVPAYLAGDGFKRFLELAAALFVKDGGLVLLEEPESFQHPRYLRELVHLLEGVAASGTQIVLSTHSLELIDLLLHEPEGSSLTYPSVHRLRLVEGKLMSVALDRARALSLRDELAEDLRS